MSNSKGRSSSSTSHSRFSFDVSVEDDELKEKVIRKLEDIRERLTATSGIMPLSSSRSTKSFCKFTSAQSTASSGLDIVERRSARIRRSNEQDKHKKRSIVNNTTGFPGVSSFYKASQEEILEAVYEQLQQLSNHKYFKRASEDKIDETLSSSNEDNSKGKVDLGSTNYQKNYVEWKNSRHINGTQKYVIENIKKREQQTPYGTYGNFRTETVYQHDFMKKELYKPLDSSRNDNEENQVEEEQKDEENEEQKSEDKKEDVESQEEKSDKENKDDENELKDEEDNEIVDELKKLYIINDEDASTVISNVKSERETNASTVSRTSAKSNRRPSSEPETPHSQYLSEYDDLLSIHKSLVSRKCSRYSSDYDDNLSQCLSEYSNCNSINSNTSSKYRGKASYMPRPVTSHHIEYQLKNATKKQNSNNRGKTGQTTSLPLLRSRNNSGQPSPLLEDAPDVILVKPSNVLPSKPQSRR
ncbi:hypothetical protein ABK040_010492 [Willaertia magna]